jgi:hypothetical protein
MRAHLGAGVDVSIRVRVARARHAGAGLKRQGLVPVRLSYLWAFLAVCLRFCARARCM